jgi:hypothetical protein
MMVEPCGSLIAVPHVIDVLAVQPATAPYISDFGSRDASGFVRPSRLRSPNARSDGFAHASDASIDDRPRAPMPASRRAASVPASQNDAPLPVVCTPPTVVVTPDVG